MWIFNCPCDCTTGVLPTNCMSLSMQFIAWCSPRLLTAIFSHIFLLLLASTGCYFVIYAGRCRSARSRLASVLRQCGRCYPHIYVGKCATRICWNITNTSYFSFGIARGGSRMLMHHISPAINQIAHKNLMLFAIACNNNLSRETWSNLNLVRGATHRANGLTKWCFENEKMIYARTRSRVAGASCRAEVNSRYFMNAPARMAHIRIDVFWCRSPVVCYVPTYGH